MLSSLATDAVEEYKDEMEDFFKRTFWFGFWKPLDISLPDLQGRDTL